MSSLFRCLLLFKPSIPARKPLCSVEVTIFLMTGSTWWFPQLLLARKSQLIKWKASRKSPSSTSRSLSTYACLWPLKMHENPVSHTASWEAIAFCYWMVHATPTPQPYHLDSEKDEVFPVVLWIKKDLKHLRSSFLSYKHWPEHS